MAKELLPDALWARSAPRLRVSDRAALTGILFVLKTGIPWEYLPKEKLIRSRGVGAGLRAGAGCETGTKWASGAGCHVLLEELAQADSIDWDRAALV